MNKTPTLIIVIRYIAIAFLVYFIWIGNLTAIKILCTIVIFHSECLYISNRLTEANARKLLNKMEATAKKTIVPDGGKNV